MAMASTTSAAASMLLSGSMPSADGIVNADFLTKSSLPFSPSLASLSASAPFPTITLDLTHNPNPNPSQFQRPLGQFHFPSPNNLPQNFVTMPQVFGHTVINNQPSFMGLLNSMGLEQPQSAQNQMPANDTISAATAAAITADPSFTAALVAAITSVIGNVHQNQNGNSNNNTTPRNSSDKIEHMKNSL